MHDVSTTVPSREMPPRPRSDAMTPFISVAFVAAILFVPFVIATGLLTDPSHDSGVLPDITVAALRGTIETHGLGLRPSQD